MAAGVSTSGGFGLFVAELLVLLFVPVSVAAVLAALAVSAGRWVETRRLKETSHKRHTRCPYVGLPHQGVEDRVHAAADKGHRGGDGPLILPEFMQPGEEREEWENQQVGLTHKYIELELQLQYTATGM